MMNQIEFKPHHTEIHGHKKGAGKIFDVEFCFIKTRLFYEINDNPGEKRAKNKINIKQARDDGKNKEHQNNKSRFVAFGNQTKFLFVRPSKQYWKEKKCHDKKQD